MDQLFQELHRLAHSIFLRVASLLREAPPGTLPLTGIVGLAIIVAGLYHLGFNYGRPSHPSQQRVRTQTRSPIRGSHQVGSVAQSKRGGHTGDSEIGGSGAWGLPIPLNELRSQLVGISKVTISVPGVMLQQRGPYELEEGASVRPDAVEIVRELASSIQTYLMAQVASDVGEAVVRGALEAAGVLGIGKRQIPPHRLVCCETLQGKVALVRQLEPELHVDADHRTIEELQRFIPQQIHIHKPGESLGSYKAGSVGHGQSLSDALNVVLD